MQFEVTESEIRQAKLPHNVFISGLFVLDLLMTPGIIVLNIGMAGLLIPLCCSLALIGYIFMRTRETSPWFPAAHWRLTLFHAKWLMIGYAASALLILLAWLLSQGALEARMQHILWTSLTRVALMPTLIAVMVTAVMEASAIGLANKGEVPAKVVKTFPNVKASVDRDQL
jgi:hypothetical protein